MAVWRTGRQTSLRIHVDRQPAWRTGIDAAVDDVLGQVGAEGGKTFVRAGSELWARFGYTTAQEGRATTGVVALLRQVADAVIVEMHAEATADLDEEVAVARAMTTPLPARSAAVQR